MPRVITLGEIMLRLAPQGYNRFVQATSLEATYGGAEANVAVSLANYGIASSFITKLPKHQIGDVALNELRRYGVDVQHIVRGGDRLGIYYLEKGASQRPSLVIYDRAGSSMQKAEVEDFDWAQIFQDADWFHFTGISPALGDNVAAICMEACREAKKRGITVSCDLNYRKKLWTKEKAARVMGELAQYVDICIANEEDANDIFGISSEHSDVVGGQLNYKAYQKVAAQLSEQCGFKKVAITLRSSISASDNKWAALLYTGQQSYFSKEYKIHIVDRVGGGDSFSAGLIFGELMDYAPQQTIEFAVAASCLKHSIEGDLNHVSADEVRKLMDGDGSGRVSR
ncbi:sugar kinase [Lachnospiraceae bacterium OF09-33XD]|nr:sugar kinase [Lachnospiraceae bacterium OF09-33XD]